MSLLSDFSAYDNTIDARILNKTQPNSITLAEEANSFKDLSALVIRSFPNQVISGLNMSIVLGHLSIQPGSWQIDARVNFIDSVLNLPIDSRDATLSRYDVVYADNNNGIHVVSGDLSVSPVEPDVPTGLIKLGSILITPTSETIDVVVAGNFTDNFNNQNIGGIKIFSRSPQVPNGVSDNDAVNVSQLNGWPRGLPTGGTTGQALIKNSNTDFDAGWQTLNYVPFTGSPYDLNLGPHTIIASQARFINTNVNQNGVIIQAGGATGSGGIILSVSDHAGNGVAVFNSNIVSYYGLIDLNSDGTFQAVINPGAANNFVVSNSGVLQYRTAAQVLADIGAAPAIGGGYVSSVTGTLNRITSSGGTTPVIDISSSYVGQTSINTVGTITTGTWSGLFGIVSGANLTNITPANISAGIAMIDISGNAATVTNGVVTTGSYANPAWITAIPYSILSGSVPTWNQNTTGSAAKLTTSRNIQGVAFDGTANINPINGTGFVKVTGTTLSYDNSSYQPLENQRLSTTNSPTFAGIKLTTGAALNYILQSDASGNASWVSITNSQTYVGTWNASTNTPTLADGTGSAGSFYRVTTAGTTDFGHGGIAFSVGDDVQYNGTLWQRLPAPTIVGNALTKTDDTNITLTLGGSPSTALLNAASITVGWTGTLADGRIASAGNWNTAYSNRIASFTTTGTGAATFTPGGALNIPTPSLSNLVPYSGAITNLNMGGFQISGVGSLTMSGSGGILFGPGGFIRMANAFGTFTGQFLPPLLTANRTYLPPDVTGTLATINGNQTFVSAIWNASIIGSTYGGSGFNNSGGLNWGAGGTLGTAAYTASSAYEVPLTFSTGLNRSANTITAVYGTTSTTATVGNDSRVNNGQIAFGWGNWALNFGTGSGTIAQGNDSRINNGQTAFSQTRQWDGGATGLVAATGRTSLGLVIGTDVLAQRSFGTAANNNTGDFEVPLTFSTGLTRSTNTITVNYGTSSTTAAAGNDSRIVNAVQIGSNISLTDTGVATYSHTTTGFLASDLVTNNYLQIHPNNIIFYQDAAGFVNTLNANTTTANRMWSLPNNSGVIALTSDIYPGAGIPISTGSAWGSSITNNSVNWNTAFSQTRQWDGGATGLVAATGRTSLGLVIGTDVLAQRSFGTAANNNTGDFEVPLTFSTGLTRSTNTITVNYGTSSTTAAAGNDSRINNGQTAFSWGNPSGVYLPLAGGTLTGSLTGTNYYSTTDGYHCHSLNGMVGNYVNQANTPMIIWTIGDTWNTLATMYGLSYDYGAYWPADHEITIRESGTNNHSFSMGGSAWHRKGLVVGTSADTSGGPGGDVFVSYYDNAATSGVVLGNLFRQNYTGAWTSGTNQGLESYMKLSGGSKNLSLGLISNIEWASTTGTANDMRANESGIVASATTGSTTVTQAVNYYSAGFASKNGAATGITVTKAVQFYAAAYDTRGITYGSPYSFYAEPGAGNAYIGDPVGIGYTADPIGSQKLFVNGNGYFNGSIVGTNINAKTLTVQNTSFGTTFFDNATSNRSLQLPNADGFVALTIRGNSTTTGTATTAVTVTIGSTMANTGYFVSIKPRDLLTAVNWYISAQTTTTFTITFASALTGSINFDWDIIP